MKKSLLFLALFATLLSGCNHSDGKPSKSLDEVEFNKLVWTYGGFSGAKSTYSKATIKGLAASGNNMAYKWTVDSNVAISSLNSVSKEKADLLACFFVKRSDGKWVGGKFEWISVSRTTRQFNNILVKHYGGWSMTGVSNPCECAFVIVNPATKVRTNVIKGVWKR